MDDSRFRENQPESEADERRGTEDGISGRLFSLEPDRIGTGYLITAGMTILLSGYLLAILQLVWALRCEPKPAGTEILSVGGED